MIILFYFNYDIDWMNDILCVQDLRMHFYFT